MLVGRLASSSWPHEAQTGQSRPTLFRRNGSDRVGNDEYARLNRSFGLTTLRVRHATVRGVG